MDEPSKPMPLAERITVHRAWRYGKMLPQAGQVREPEINHLSVFVLDCLQDIFCCGTIQNHMLSSCISRRLSRLDTERRIIVAWWALNEFSLSVSGQRPWVPQSSAPAAARFSGRLVSSW